MGSGVQSSLRVLHAPHDIGGNAYYLARGERACGVDARNLVYTKQWYGYPADICLRLPQDSNPTHALRWWWTMARVALSADVLHFNFGASFLTYFPTRWVYADLPLWRALGLAVCVTFQGCESRLSQYVMTRLDTRFCAGCRSWKDLCAPHYDTFKREVLAQADRYCDRIFVLNPDLLPNIPRGEFLPYSNCDIEEWRPPAGFDWRHAGPVRIVHAPTNRPLKGTAVIIEAVAALQAEGLPVELVLVENVPHERVRALYESADLLVDQILIGWYGGLAVELMALGKPVVAYLREADLRFLPPAMRRDLPVVSADAATLQAVLRPLIQDVERRRALGARARAFVEAWHDPRVVGKWTTEAYREIVARRPPVRGMARRLRTVSRVLKPTLRHFARLYSYQYLPCRLARRIRTLVGG